MKGMRLTWLVASAVLTLGQAQEAWINEFHYDNSSSDTNEFVEIAYNPAIDVSQYTVLLYNGINGQVYRTLGLASGNVTGNIGLTSVAVSGLQNGPDGIALVDGLTNTVVEFISYEGSFVATDGPAASMTSIDIGVSETSSTLSTESIQRTGIGCSASDFVWASSPQPSTKETANVGQLFPCSESVWINEFHYDNSGADTGEFVEIAYTLPVNIVDYSLLLYNGVDGKVYQTKSLEPGVSVGSGVFLTSLSVSGLQNGPDGIALVGNSGMVVQFISYEGDFVATDGAASGMTSTDVGVQETSSTSTGDSIQATGLGCGPSDFTWASPQLSTSEGVNHGQSFDCGSLNNSVPTSSGDIDVAMLSNPSGSGSIPSISVDAGSTVVVGDIPVGVSDVYIELISATDVDIQLYAGSTALIHRTVSSSGRSHTNWNGLRIEYSGFNGEDTSTTQGMEFLFLSGHVNSTLSLRVYGDQSGSVTVKYWWGYYNTAQGLSGNSLKDELHEIIDDHTELTYLAAWGAIQRTDQYVGDPNFVMTLYSRRPTPKVDQDDGNNLPDDWNREHVWAKSHGHFGTVKGPGTDIHALRASDRSVNTERSSKDFAAGGMELSTIEAREDCPDCRETSASFEPPDAVKGSVARMILYMATRYNGDEGSNDVSLTAVNGVGTELGSSTFQYGELGDLATLLDWNALYPPTDEEYYRNNIIFQVQGNRNPFVDHPEWADAVFL